MLCYACISEPPHIHPFTLGDGYHVGGRVGWQCFITKGDGPLSIQWLKNNQSLDPASTPSLSVSYQNEYSSSVLIESIRLAHEGNYTCRATNPVASVDHTVALTVLGTYQPYIRFHSRLHHTVTWKPSLRKNALFSTRRRVSHVVVVDNILFFIR